MVVSRQPHPFFSVVIPLYNKADTIERAIRSVAAQTCREFELIVVNDGSVDQSLDVVERLSSNIPMHVINKANGGVSSARNTGAKAAKGKYIALLDGDDVWYPMHLVRLREAILQHPDIKFFGAGYEMYKEPYVYYTIPWGGCCIKDVYSAYRYGQPIHTSTVVIERALWMTTGGFDEQYSFYEDYEFFFRLGLHTKCCVIRNIGARYNSDAESQATRQKRVFSRETRPHLKFIDDQLKSGAASRSMKHYAVTQLALAFSFCCRRGGDISEYVRCFPNIGRNSKLIYSLKQHPIVASIFSLVFLSIYRLRNHMIIWRRHENK